MSMAVASGVGRMGRMGNGGRVSWEGWMSRMGWWDRGNFKGGWVGEGRAIEWDCLSNGSRVDRWVDPTTTGEGMQKGI